MESKKVFWTTLLHIELLVLGFCIFIFFFQTNLFKNSTVFFYRGISFLLLTCIVLTGVLVAVWFLSKHGVFTVRDIILSLALVFCFNLVFFTHIPVTADRSISVFLLDFMNNYPEKSFTKKEIESVFVDKYVIKSGAMSKRFEEQMVSGNISEAGERYQISGQGRLVAKFYSIVVNLFEIGRDEALD